MSEKKRSYPHYTQEDADEKTAFDGLGMPAARTVQVEAVSLDGLEEESEETHVESFSPNLIERMRSLRQQALSKSKLSPSSSNSEGGIALSDGMALSDPSTRKHTLAEMQSWSSGAAVGAERPLKPLMSQSKKKTEVRIGPKEIYPEQMDDFGLVPMSGAVAPPGFDSTRVNTSVHQIDLSGLQMQEDERYHQGPILAKGGMGYIRKVFDKKIMRQVAMKMLKPKVAKHRLELQRFLGEAQITGQLEHPNIVPVYDVGVDHQGNHYFTMQLVKGRTLKKYLHDGHYDPGSEEQLYRALQIFIKVCEALAFAHSKGVIHRDLKPANIMVGEHGEVYLMDWGIACVLHQKNLDTHISEPVFLSYHAEQKDMDIPGAVIGSLSYVAPEQALGQTEKIDKRADIFSLGAILYEILTLTPPYQGKSFNHLLLQAKEANIPTPQERRPFVHLPHELCAIAMRAMKKHPDERFQSVHELKEAVEVALRGGGRYQHQSFPKGTLIVREGEPADMAYGIVRGRCRVYKYVGGKHVVLRDMGPGEVFGEAAVISDKPRSASVEALEDVTLICIQRATLVSEFGFGTWLGRLVKTIAERFHENDAKRFALLQKNQLLQLANRVSAMILAYGRPDYEGKWFADWTMVEGQLSRQEGDELQQQLAAIDGLYLDYETGSISLELQSFMQWLGTQSEAP